MLHDLASHKWRQASLVGLVAMVAIAFATYSDYGVTWDEFYHIANGKHVLAYYATWFEDRSVLTYHNLYLYGGVFDGLVATANLVSPLGTYETAHLLNALVGLLGVVGCWKLTNVLAGPRAAFVAALLLLLTPAWYGHMFNNPKDIPFAAGMAWSLYYMARLGDALPAPPWALVVKLGVALGLTIGMRVGGVMALFYLAVVVAAYLVVRWRADDLHKAVREGVGIGLRTVLPASLIGYVVMLLCWPWAQQDPLNNPYQALRLFSHIKWDINVLYAGRLVNSLHLPADYLPVYFLIKLPEVVLVLLLLAIPVLIGTAMVRRAAHGGTIRPGYVLLFTAIAFPFAYFIIERPVTYDCVRHFLFVLPPIAAAAGIVADQVIRHARTQLLRRATIGAFATMVAWQIVTMIRLHPDEYIYYNELVGGVKGAEDKFELDYWGNSYAEAVGLLHKYLKKEAGGVPTKNYRVMVCSSGTSASYFFPPYLTLADNEFEADFYISVTRLDCDDAYDGDEIIKVERDGATLSVVKDRRRLRIEHPERMRMAGPPDIRVHPGAIDETMIR